MTASSSPGGPPGVSPGAALAPPLRSAPLARVLREVWSLAWKELRYDRRTALVLALTVAAILAPLLLLLGLKNGAVATLRATLIEDPRNREIVIYGSARLARSWFAEMAARPEVAFVVPKTRSINASVDLVDARRRLVQSVELLPTAPGDPLLPPGSPVPATADEVLVTESLAARLARTGDPPWFAVVKRTHEGEPQQMRIALKTLGVVPAAQFSREALFVSLDLLAAAEDYRDGVLPPEAQENILSGYAQGRALYANGRLYASDLEEVAPLAERLRAEGIEVRTQAERIATVQAFDRALTFVFRVVAVIGGVGCALALGGALWLNVERNRRHLALLRLFGFAPAAVAAVPAIQGLTVAALGFALACCGYLAGAEGFDAALRPSFAGGGYASHLDFLELATAAGVVLTIALLASLAGAFRAGRVDPAEGLRESSL